jgi:hypothetical protein
VYVCTVVLNVDRGTGGEQRSACVALDVCFLFTDSDF